MSNRDARFTSYAWSSMGVMACLLMVAGCEQPTTFIPGQTDRFITHSEDSYSTANAILQADYLFTIDYSYSMQSKADELLNDMDSFTADLRSKGIDYRIAFTKGNSHNNSASTIATSFMGSVLSLDTLGSLEQDVLNQVKTVGDALNENTNYLLEASLRSMTAQADSFSRASSQLVYVYVSDSDDRSDQNTRITGDKSVDGYASRLAAFKVAPAYVSARSLTAGVATDCALQHDYDEAGTRIAHLAQTLDSAGHAPDCIYKPFTESLSDLARNVTKPTNRYLLLSKPLGGVVHVYENGGEVAASGNWSFSASTNEIIFEAGHEPSPSSQLRFTYDIAYVLSKTPKVNTISVTVNGQTVQKSDTNGWSYVTGENRVAFNGSAAPADKADVRITYQVQ